MVESDSSRRHRYTSGERAWWTSCVFRATRAYASKNGRIRQLLEVGADELLEEQDVLGAALIIQERFPITWLKDISIVAMNIQLGEVSKKARELAAGRGGLSQSALEARRILGIEYEDIKTKRHPALEKLERFLFAEHDKQTGVSPQGLP